MLDTKSIDQIAAKITEAIPGPLRDAQKEFEKTLKVAIQTTLQKLDLITREEFDVQMQMLTRTREKLDRLEEKISTMESSSTTEGKSESKTKKNRSQSDDRAPRASKQPE